MRSVANRIFPHAAFCLASGILTTLGLLLFIKVLADYRTHTSEARPPLIVDLTAWPAPVKQPPQPRIHKQPMPKRPVENKHSPPRKPKLSPRPKRVEKEIPQKTPEHESEEEIMEESVRTAEPSPAEPTPPMLIQPGEDALPEPVPIFKLTQAPRFLHRENPVYPEAMRAQGISGIVRLEALIDKDGKVRKVNILKSAGRQFDEAARRAILASTFYPAEVKNEPVAVLLRLPVRFDLF